MTVSVRSIAARISRDSNPTNGLAGLHIPGHQWEAQAACRDQPDPNLWFSDNPYDRVMAATICERDCPVKDLCERAATDRKEHWGIYGGIDFGARRGRKRTRPAYCINGHLLADDMYVLRGGREVKCGTCRRQQSAEWAAKNIERIRAANERRRVRDKATRDAKKKALGEGSAA